jgi:hypothetical protein
MNVGFIHRALPGARILNIVRDPMDTCFANLRELFGAEAYPYSYEQRELAAHYRDHRRLMAHWHEVLPGRMLDVSYEALVADPERVARQVFKFCGLQWVPGCASIEKRTAPTATAAPCRCASPSIRAPPRPLLEHKYTRDRGRIYLSGVQALVRLPLMQRLRDRAAGLNTAGFISGYRGSPLGGFDLELWRAKKHLEAPSTSKFTPGLNEDLARRWCGARSRSTCSRARRSTACSACGTARARASTAAATCSSTPTPPAPRRSTAACWRWRRRPRAASRRRCRTVGARIRQRDDAGAQPGRRAGHPRPRPARLGDVALHRPLGRLQDDRRDGGVVGLGRRRSARARHRAARPISRCRRAASTSAGPIRRWTRRCACTSTR